MFSKNLKKSYSFLIQKQTKNIAFLNVEAYGTVGFPAMTEKAVNALLFEITNGRLRLNPILFA